MVMASSVQHMKLSAAVWELVKPRIVGMVLVTAGLGYFLGSSAQDTSILTLLCMLVGTGSAAAGAAVLNNYLERDSDVSMARTRGRVLPARAIDPSFALFLGVVLVLTGTAILGFLVNLLSAFLVLLTAFLYVLVYTPMKRISWWNTPIGAIPGALPPMVGWASATNDLGPGAWALFLILFIWQHPHFYSIAWIFRDDYRKAGLQMLSVVDPSGRRLFRQSILFCVALLPVSMSLHWLDLAGQFYFVGAIFSGAAFLTTVLMLWNFRTPESARRVLLASVAYLPLLLALIIIDAGIR